MISRRRFLASTAGAGAAAFARLPARAQAYPNNIVRIIVPFPPGGATERAPQGHQVSSVPEEAW